MANCGLGFYCTDIGLSFAQISLIPVQKFLSCYVCTGNFATLLLLNITRNCNHMLLSAIFDFYLESEVTV